MGFFASFKLHTFLFLRLLFSFAFPFLCYILLRFNIILLVIYFRLMINVGFWYQHIIVYLVLYYFLYSFLIQIQCLSCLVNCQSHLLHGFFSIFLLLSESISIFTQCFPLLLKSNYFSSSLLSHQLTL